MHACMHSSSLSDQIQFGIGNFDSFDAALTCLKIIFLKVLIENSLPTRTYVRTEPALFFGHSRLLKNKNPFLPENRVLYSAGRDFAGTEKREENRHQSKCQSKNLLDHTFHPTMYYYGAGFYSIASYIS